MNFSIIGQGDPFLHVTLEHGEQIYCESGAMVSIDSTLELKSKMQGGFLASLARKLADGESFFNQSVIASGGRGDVLLSPELPGDLQILDVGGNAQYFLNDGAFLAATDQVAIETVVQRNIGGALYGGTGGFLIMKTNGIGKLAISGFGTLMELDVTYDNPITVDNFHVVAWDASLDYDISKNTLRNGSFLGNLVNSVTSGEGLVLKFSGIGKVYVCSRNRGAFLGWMKQNIGLADSSNS